MDPLPPDFHPGDDYFDLFNGTDDIFADNSLFSDPIFTDLDLSKSVSGDSLDFTFGLEELDPLLDTGCQLPDQKMLELPLPSYEAPKFSNMGIRGEIQSVTDLNNEGFTSQPNSKAIKTHNQDCKAKDGGLEIVFSLDSGKEVARRGRKRFSAARKKEVARHRAIGACVQCKVRRGPCSLGIPCDHCIKRAGSIALGQEICKRESLVTTRFDQLEIFQIESSAAELVKYNIAYAHGTTSTNAILDFSLTRGVQSQYSLPVRVLNLSYMGEEELKLYTYDYYGAIHWTRKVPVTLIDWGCLPTSDEIIRSCSASRPHFSPSPLYSLKCVLKEFADEYCNISCDMPLQNLIKECLRLHQLFVAYYAVPAILVHGSTGREYPSVALLTQLRLIVARDAIACELSVLGQIDKIVQGNAGYIERRNALGLWLALWIVILNYQERMMWLEFRNTQACKPLHALSKHIYNTLTSIYNALFKTSSPLTLDWRKEDIYELLGRNPKLIRLFSNIKTEIFWLQTVQDDLRPNDELFKQLIVENDNRLLKAQLKKARKLGIV